MGRIGRVDVLPFRFYVRFTCVENPLSGCVTTKTRRWFDDLRRRSPLLRLACLSNTPLVGRLQRGSIVVAGRLARPLVKATNVRGLASWVVPLHSSLRIDTSVGRCPTAAQKPLPRASFRLGSSSRQQGQVVGVDPAAGQVSDERPAKSGE